MASQTGADQETVVVTHRCTHCEQNIEVLDLSGVEVLWQGKRSTIEWIGHTQYQCHACHINQAKPEQRDDLVAFFQRFLSIRDHVGIPKAVTLHLLTGRSLGQETSEKGFRLSLFGIQVRNWDPASPVPSLQVAAEGEMPDLEYALPQIVIWRENVSAAIECRWSTDDPTSPATALEIVGWQGVSRLSELHDLIDGLALLRDFPVKGGRPKDSSRMLPPERFASEISGVYLGHLTRFGMHPTNGELAVLFGVSRSTMERTIRRYREDGNPWPPSLHS